MANWAPLLWTCVGVALALLGARLGPALQQHSLPVVTSAQSELMQLPAWLASNAPPV
jgi:hypothetical protein